MNDDDEAEAEYDEQLIERDPWIAVISKGPDSARKFLERPYAPVKFVGVGDRGLVFHVWMEAHPPPEGEGWETPAP